MKLHRYLQFTLLSLLTIASVPFIAIALEPLNPVGLCSRFVSEKDQKSCEEKTSQDDVDWYAASICNLQKEDAAFWTCWESAKNQSFNPQALESCDDHPEISDQERQSCLNKAKLGRVPSSEKDTRLFQPLRVRPK